MRVVSLLYFAFCAVLLPFSSGSANRASAQEIRITDNVVASPKQGWHPFYEMHVDPDNAANMIICGARFEAKDNAFYGFVYASSDGGKTWRQALEDINSTFESEHSCAFGVHGVAYYLASASKVIGGEPHHELGTTRIYLSRDSGKSWKLGTTTGWTDYSTAVVDTRPGANLNRLYVFFNNLQTFYSSVGSRDRLLSEKHAGNGSRVGMISYKDGDSAVAGPFSSEGMTKEEYRGSYPAPAILMKDGSILVFYTAKRSSPSGAREFIASAVRVNAIGTGLEAPIKIIDSLDETDNQLSVPCGGFFLGSGAAYDIKHDKLYYAFPGISGRKCQLFLTTSNDSGTSWSKAEPLRSLDLDVTHQYESSELAVNRDGTLGVLWRDEEKTGCWIIAASTDGGKSLSRGQRLGSCSDTKLSTLNTASLWTSFSQADPKEPGSMIRINLRSANNSVWRNSSALITTPDGSFHPVWIDAQNGTGEIKTAQVNVASAESLMADATDRLVEVTHTVKMLFGGNQFYDSKSEILSLEVSLHNDGPTTIRGPIRLAVSSLSNRNGIAEIENSENKASGAGAIWDMSGSVAPGGLAPGDTSRPFSLKFHYMIESGVERNSDDVLGLTIRVFGAGSSLQPTTEQGSKPEFKPPAGKS